jgi:putative inorganic carbon (hco3(-)) transporter
MNAAPHSTPTWWEQITLQSLPLYQWRSVSYVARLVGLLQGWRSGSVLLQYGDGIGLGLLGVLFGVAPYISTTLISVLLVACMAFWFLLTIADQRETVGWGLTPIHLLLLLFWGVSVVSTGLSPVKASAVIGLAKLTMYFVLFLLLARVMRVEKWRSILIGIYLLTSLPVSYYGIWQYFAGVPPLATWSDPGSEAGNFTRAYSFLGNPNLLASYLIPAIAYSLMAIFAWVGPLRKLLAVLMLGCNIACVFYTGSRGAGIGLALMTVTIVLLLGFWIHLYERKKWLLPVIGGGMVGVIALSVLVIPAVRNRALSLFVGRGDSSNNYRINVWYSAIEMIKRYPVLGIGPGDDAFKKMYPLYSRVGFTALSAYSVLLEIAVETGFMGLASFAWLLLVTFTQAGIQLRKLRDRANGQGFWLMGAIAAMVGLLGQGFVDTVWYRPQVNTLWWMAVAIVASFYSALPTDVRKPIAPSTDLDE